ncbi:MAG: 4-hydroxy-tetrahydrodipicolinate synthase [Oscillospiraceae bacterium]|nr:4-hydroxy-tetrahydrodipicolinate synthase [Oscillospiraceae bacterium]
MKQPIFLGSCTAMVTPFGQHGIDYSRFAKHIDFQASENTNAILISGTTGENATQSFEEHCALLRFAAEYNNGRMKLIAGIGANNTMTALEYGKLAEDVGYDGVLMVTPYYNKTTQKGLIEHFTYVADRIRVPMILYNVPSRTGIGITAETYKILSEHPNINGIKEASGDFSLFSKVRCQCRDSLYIWCGNDDQTVPMMALGAKGVISVASNIIPGVISKLCQLCLDGNFYAAEQLHLEYGELFSDLFLETNPIPVKTAMNLMGMEAGSFRLHLIPMQHKNEDTLKVQLRKHKLV